jgi:hypothetical protein
MRTNISPAIELLEARRLLSVTVAEAEPNDTPPEANPVPRVIGESVHVTGALEAPGSQDWFKIELEVGDVFGASLRGVPGLDGMIGFGQNGLLIHNDDSFFRGAFALPAESPMPQHADDIRDPEIFYVVTAPGTYFFQISAFVDPDTGETSTGAYDLEVVVARPGMESKPIGARQILFLDFDGGSVAYEGGERVVAFDPFITSLSEWGLNATDLNKLVNETIKRSTDKLYTFIAANGLNGEYAKSKSPGEFGLEIRNSLDHADPAGDPLVARVILGHTDDEQFATEHLGEAQFTDVGNFKQDDQAAVSTNFVAGLLADFPIAKPGNRSLVIDFVAEYMSWFIAHEFGHLVGLNHTQFTFENSFIEQVDLMDKDIRLPMGPDHVFGTADDVILQFSVDAYDPNEVYLGVNDTLNTMAFGLSTGKATAIPTTALSELNMNRPGFPSGAASGKSLSAFDSLGDDGDDDGDGLPLI